MYVSLSRLRVPHERAEALVRVHALVRPPDLPRSDRPGPAGGDPARAPRAPPHLLDERVTWLADVLAARDFPLEHLADNLDIAADVAGEEVGPAVAERLRAAAALVRAR